FTLSWLRLSTPGLLLTGLLLPGLLLPGLLLTWLLLAGLLLPRLLLLTGLWLTGLLTGLLTGVCCIGSFPSILRSIGLATASASVFCIHELKIIFAYSPCNLHLVTRRIPVHVNHLPWGILLRFLGPRLTCRFT